MSLSSNGLGAKQIYDAVLEYLEENGPSTCKQIAEGCPHIERDAILIALRRMDGVNVRTSGHKPRTYHLIRRPRTCP